MHLYLLPKSKKKKGGGGTILFWLITNYREIENTQPKQKHFPKKEKNTLGRALTPYKVPCIVASPLGRSWWWWRRVCRTNLLLLADELEQRFLEVFLILEQSNPPRASNQWSAALITITQITNDEMKSLNKNGRKKTWKVVKQTHITNSPFIQIAQYIIRKKKKKAFPENSV